MATQPTSQPRNRCGAFFPARFRWGLAGGCAEAVTVRR